VRALILLAILATPAAAERLTMRQADATNLHIANQGGAINWREDTTITLDLLAKGRTELVSKGTRSESNLYVQGTTSWTTKTEKTWTTTWKGTWKIAKGMLSLELDLDKDACSATRDDSGAITQETCRAATKRAILSCTTTAIEVQHVAKKVASWSCSPAAGSTLGESPSSFVFGKDRCLERSSGKMTANSYKPC
jgi:hypothetical protein